MTRPVCEDVVAEPERGRKRGILSRSWTFRAEQSLWKKNKAENSHAVKRLHFFHTALFHVHIRTHNLDSTSGRKRLVSLWTAACSLICIKYSHSTNLHTSTDDQTGLLAEIVNGSL